MRVLVPMAGHDFGLHDGHRALIEWAKIFGDVHVAITPDWLKLQVYLLHGRKYVPEQDISSQVKSIEDLGVPYHIRPPILIGESRRLELKKEVEAIIDCYSEEIILDRYRDFLIAAAMQRIIRKVGYDLVVRAPEAPTFILKALQGPFGWIDMKIYHEIVKNKDGIKLQSLLNREEIKSFDLKKLKKAEEDLRPTLKKGNNIELVREINLSIQDPEWKLSNAAVFEGSIFKGRVEVFSFFVKGIFIEDNDYYPEE